VRENMDDKYWERIEKKIDEIHARIMRKPGRQPGYKPKKLPKATKEGGDGSPAPSPQSPE